VSASLAIPSAWIEGATRTHRRLEGTVGALTEDDARGPSALPGWTRGHVITHIARNANAIDGMTEAAKRGEMQPMYPGGSDERDRDIEAGAPRGVAELLADLEAAQRGLEETWASVPEDVWQTGTGYRLAGPATIADFVFIRWRESSIHSVDLAVARSRIPRRGMAVDDRRPGRARAEGHRGRPLTGRPAGARVRQGPERRRQHRSGPARARVADRPSRSAGAAHPLVSPT
jgi:uncharacterized protein (TIGR03083 family)